MPSDNGNEQHPAQPVAEQPAPAVMFPQPPPDEPALHVVLVERQFSCGAQFTMGLLFGTALGGLRALPQQQQALMSLQSQAHAGVPGLARPALGTGLQYGLFLGVICAGEDVIARVRGRSRLEDSVISGAVAGSLLALPSLLRSGACMHARAPCVGASHSTALVAALLWHTGFQPGLWGFAVGGGAAAALALALANRTASYLQRKYLPDTPDYRVEKQHSLFATLRQDARKESEE